jgi:uncharacterized membrane protein (UPF0127 family)
MPEPLLAQRLHRLPVTAALGHEVRVARGSRARFLGLAHLDRERAGSGLLIPRCSSVHTFGMRFPLDLYFLGGHGEVVAVRRGVPARRLAFCGRARAVLEVPAEEGGEILAATS